MTTADLHMLLNDELVELEALAASRPITTETLTRYEALRQRVVAHERQLCFALKREVVVPLADWPARWTQSHTDVRIDARQWRAWLAFECLSDSGGRRAFLWEFEDAQASRLTAIDYDNLEQHPLYHSGLEGLGAYTVENSGWVAGLGVGRQRPGRTHYLFCFNSCLVECVAGGVKLTSEADSIAGVWHDVPHV